MFGRLKKKLILLYGVTTSVVLIVILFVVGYLTQVQSKSYRISSFEQSVRTVIQKLETEQSLSSLWIAEMQSSNKIYIYVEENGTPYSLLLNQGLINEYNEYIQQVKDAAIKDNLNLETPLIKNKLQQTKTFEIKGKGLDSKYACGVIIPTVSNCLTVIMIERDMTQSTQILHRMMLYGLIGFLGVGALFLISSVYIHQILKPLQAGQKRQVEFVAAASHELRAPLTVIQTGLTAIKDDPQQMDTFMPYLEDECERMTHLISDLLLLATSDAKSWSLNCTMIDMDTFLIEIYDMFCCMQKERESTITLETSDEELHSVSGDRERLKQVLTILIDNGWSYTKKEMGIAIRAYNRKHQVVIEVIDHGPGIPEEQREKVFERFYQGDSSRTDKKHYGLGLSIAKEIVTMHGGNLSCKDTEGGGATFCMVLNAENE